MTKVQRFIGVAAAFVLMVGLSACSDGQDYTGDKVSEFTMTAHDGTKIPCYKVEALHGYVCNFDKAVGPSATVPKP